MDFLVVANPVRRLKTGPFELDELTPETTVSRLRRSLSHHQNAAALTMAEAARQLRLSPRTLARRLRAEGTTFTRERDRFRRERSLLRIVLSDVPLTTIALDLGFADLACFCRAFRRWHHCAPSALRRRRPEATDEDRSHDHRAV